MSPDQRVGAGHTKPPMLGVHFSTWRAVVAAVLAVAWVAASWGRLNPVLVAIPPIAIVITAFGTIYHVALTRWMRLWWGWRSGRNTAIQLPAGSSAHDVFLESGTPIGVLIENETLVTAIKLVPDPCAPTVVAGDEERTVNTVALGHLAQLLRVDDLRLSSIDVISTGYRAAGPFADRYQQIIGPVPAAVRRDTWIVMRINIEDNLAALTTGAASVRAAERAAALACQLVADALAGEGVDARPMSTKQIVSANSALQGPLLISDNWSHLASANNHACIYYADPAHIREDVMLWWTWPQATDVSTLIRLIPSSSGPRLGALVRYRAVMRPKTPPVSRLAPLYGLQKPMSVQFRIGSPPSAASIPTAPLADSDVAVPYGPTGQLIGFIGSDAVHMPLAGAVTVLCGARLLLREVALRATVTGRPMVVVTDRPDLWSRIVECATNGTVVESVPEAIDESAILVIDGECPPVLPDVTVLTTDDTRAADIEFVDIDIQPQQYTFTLSTRLGLSARVRAIETREERRLLI
jgi:ESX secretion system protein EccE